MTGFGTNNPRNKRRLIALVGVLVVILALFRPAQTRLGEYLALRSETMNLNWFHELITASPRPRRFILRAWDTGKVPHREEVLELLNDFGATNLLAPEDLHRVLTSALSDADESARELALSIAMARNDPGFTDGAIRQLRDIDSEMRFTGLRALRAANPRQAIPALAPFLNDPDRFFAGTALITIQNLSQHDFGLRPGQSTNELHAAAQRALEWWSEHKANYPSVNLAPIPPDTGAAIADFALTDLDGNPVHLSDYRGKTVLLNFWTTWCGACRSEFPTLNELQSRHTNEFVILAISLDGANGETFKDSSESSNAPEKPATLPEIRKEVSRVVKTQKLNYKILLDPSSEIGSRFNGGALPTNVFIDREGRLRRRFIGTRDLATFEAMLGEIQN